MKSSTNNSLELVPLPLLGLGDLGHGETLPRELLEQLLQDLAVIQILLHVLDDDSLAVQLIIDPLDQDGDKVLQPGVVVGPGLDHGALLVLLQEILLGRDLRGLGHPWRVDGVLALDLDLLHLGGLLLPAQGAHLIPEAVLPHLGPGPGAGAGSAPDTCTASYEGNQGHVMTLSAQKGPKTLLSH